MIPLSFSFFFSFLGTPYFLHALPLLRYLLALTSFPLVDIALAVWLHWLAGVEYTRFSFHSVHLNLRLFQSARNAPLLTSIRAR